MDADRPAPHDHLEALVRAEFEATARGARVPSAELVWYRAQMRAREEAARAAARPILFTQALAMAALIGLAASLVGRLWTLLPAASLLTAELSRPLMAAVAVAVGAWLIVAPVAAYLVFSRD